MALPRRLPRRGPIELVPALEDIGDWLRAHPTEVVTLIVQDDISAEDTEEAFRTAGLDDLLHTPDADPDAPWPTLEEMIDSGRRLVVFAERPTARPPGTATSTGTAWRPVRLPEPSR